MMINDILIKMEFHNYHMDIINYNNNNDYYKNIFFTFNKMSDII